MNEPRYLHVKWRSRLPGIYLVPTKHVDNRVDVYLRTDDSRIGHIYYHETVPPNRRYQYEAHIRLPHDMEFRVMEGRNVDHAIMSALAAAQSQFYRALTVFTQEIVCYNGPGLVENIYVETDSTEADNAGDAGVGTLAP